MGTPDPPQRREPQVYRQTRVEFLGEQDGAPERDLKRELRDAFAEYPGIAQAYLALVGYQPADQKSVALCLVSKVPDDEAVVRRVADIFARSFGKDVRLDIIFVDKDQHADLQRVCQPFFTTPPNEEL